MSDASAIEWTDATWNVVTGCKKVSPGCDNCYAETFAERWRGVKGHHFEGGFDLVLRPERLGLPLRWKKPRRIFVNSMSDLFHEGVPDEFIARVFAVMAQTPQHTYQILTKRHGRMRSLLRDRCRCRSGHSPGTHFRSAMAWAASKGNENRIPGMPDDSERQVYFEAGWPLPNVWLGVSAENQQWANIRVPALLGTQAAVRFLSAEPLLGPISMHKSWVGNDPLMPDERGLDWVICGGESGPRARPAHPGWFRSLRDQCTAAAVPFFFKQFGEWAPNGKVGIGCSDPRERLVGPPDERGFREVIRRVGKKRAGRELDGRTWDEFPEAWS